MVGNDQAKELIDMAILSDKKARRARTVIVETRAGKVLGYVNFSTVSEAYAVRDLLEKAAKKGVVIRVIPTYNRVRNCMTKELVYEHWCTPYTNSVQSETYWCS